MAKVEGNPFHTAATLKVVVNFPGHEQIVRNRLRAANLRSRLVIPREVHKEEHIEERWKMVFGIMKVFFSVEVTFSTTKEGPIFLYRPPGTRFDHIYSAIRARSVEYLCRVGGGFLAVERAQSIAVTGNSISRNINGCWNALWHFNLGYYILMEFFSFSTIVIQPKHLN